MEIHGSASALYYTNYYTNAEKSSASPETNREALRAEAT
jgi:hypothetical protein